MKKITKFILILLMFLSFNINKINVFAEGENNGNESGESLDTDEPVSGEEEDNLKSDATLKSIVINKENIVCSEKSSGFLCEKIITDNDVTSVKVTYTLTNPKASADIESGFTKELSEDDVTEFSITVTSEDKTKSNTYNFKITKKILSTVSTLDKLIVNGTEITLKEDVYKYQTTVSFATKKIDIEAVPSDTKATIADFKNNKASFDFYNNSKEIKIKVKSEAGDMTTYTLTVNKRGETDATLKSLTIKNHKIEFSSDVTDYEIKVLKNVSKLEIEAKATSKDASVKITNPKLSIGENVVKIEVTNDGDSTTYTINVTKLDEDDKTLANLKTLEIEGYNLDFKPDKYEYDLRIGDVNYLIINADAKLEEADVDITGNLDLENGSIIKIKVNYDEEYQNVYKINIIKDGRPIVRKKISKKAIVLVMGFDILSMITISAVQIINKKKEIKKSKQIKKEEIIDII